MAAILAFHTGKAVLQIAAIEITRDHLPALIPPSWSENVGYVINVNILSIPLGDVNGNGQVDLADAILALKACAGVVNAADVSIMADVNGDRSIGLPEVIYILQKDRPAQVRAYRRS